MDNLPVKEKGHNLAVVITTNGDSNDVTMSITSKDKLTNNHVPAKGTKHTFTIKTNQQDGVW